MNSLIKFFLSLLLKAVVDMVNDRVKAADAKEPLPPAALNDVGEPKPIPASDKPSPGALMSTMYVPWDRRQEWAGKIDLEYTVWRGDRDLGFLLNRPDYCDAFGINKAKLAADVREMQELNDRGDRLIWRVKNEKHRKFRDRSQVRKAVVNDMVSRLKEATDLYNEYRAVFPYGEGYDSIKGFIEWRDANGLGASKEPGE